MRDFDYTLLIYFLFTITAGFGFFRFLSLRHRHRMEEKRLRLEEAKYNIGTPLNEEDTTKETERNIRGMQNKFKEAAEQPSDLRSGGFIILDLPDEQRSIFHDLLKGFEEYAKLRGYTIYFSVDNSLPDKIAFKFTLGTDGISVSTQTVRKDIKDYMDKIHSDDTLDDLPIIIPPDDHNLILTTMKNRLSFVHHNLKLYKNSSEFYEKLFNKISSSPLGISHQPSVIVQTGGINKANHYIASNSPQALIGEHNSLHDNSDNSDHSIITISNSFNVRKEQIEKIKELIDLLKMEPDIADDKKQNAIINFDKVREELEEEEQPDKSKIKKWLIKAKHSLEGLVLAHHTTEAIHWVYESFKLIKNVI